MRTTRTSRRKRISRPDASPVLVEGELVIDDAVAKAARPAEWDRLNRLFKVQDVGGRFVIRRRAHLVGAAQFGGQIFVAPSPVPIRTFLGMVQLAHGVAVPTTAALGLDDQRTPDLLRAALGASLVQAIELAGKRHIEKVYATREESLDVVRGRPLWSRQLGAAPPRVVCRYEIQTTDSLLNRLLLAGLQAARPLQPPGALRRRADRQVFSWLGLASRPASVSREDFRRASAGLNRQTAHYRAALALAEALLLGHGAPSDSNSAGYDLPMYNLAPMFERVVEILTTAAVGDHGLTVKAQHTRSDALLDGKGSVYRRIRPDLVIYRAGRPIAVLDAKFKPRYLTGGLRPPMAARVVLADAYQLFFYAERLRRLHHLAAPVPAFIVAPALEPDDVPPAARRFVRWGDSGSSDEIGLRVLGLPLVEAVDALLSGSKPGLAAQAAPELMSAMNALSLAPAFPAA